MTQETTSSSPSIADFPQETVRLRPRQAVFVREYLKDQNASRAATVAGYSPKSARHIGAENLTKPNIAAAIAEGLAQMARRQAAHLEQIELNNRRTELETARIAFFDIRRLFRPDGTMKEVSELDLDTAAAVASVDVQEVWKGEGQSRVLVSRVRKYRFADKNAALERAAKILGMFGKDNAQKTDPLTQLLAELGRSPFPVSKEGKASAL